jgi:uncharacterized lipoprotein YajG
MAESCMKTPKGIVLSLLACLLFSGCVVGRRSVSLTIPTAPSTGATSKGTVVINKIADTRRFQNKPTDPSMPSIDGDVNSISAEERKMFIGRQRNGFGKAMGDIALPAGQNVENRSFELLKEGFARRGYAVVAQGDGKDTVEVGIDEFWAWFSPGFATISFESRITCKLIVRRGDQTQIITVSGHGLNKGQVASDANWALAYTRSFDDFLKNLDTELAKAGF